jgi:hypothetical protein
MAQPGQIGLTASAFNPNRRWSAFLAHLSLQYDGVKEQRKIRAERLKSAIQSYGLDAASRIGPHARRARGLSI